MQVNLTTLKNGLRVATVERPQTETVSLGIWTNTGSAYETTDVNGISHFVEHMVFKGTQKRNSLQISEDIENVGGNTNAYTSREFTVFYAKMLKNDLELALDVLADFIMAPTFDEQEMTKEKEVVVQEIKQTNDDPSDIVFDYFNETAYSNQAIGRSILGTADLVRSFNADKLRKYMSSNYAAENMVVAAVGNLKHDDFVKMVESRMINLREKTSYIREKQIYTGGEFIKIRDTEQAQVLLGFNGVDYHHDLYYPVAVMSSILGGGMSSRLYQEIREKRGLVYTVYSFTNSHTQSGIFGVYAGLNEEEIKNYMPVVADEIKKIINEQVSDKELSRVKVQMKANILMALESSSSTAEVIARHQLCHNRNIPMEEIVEKIEKVGKDDVMKAAQYIFNSKPTYTLLGNLEKYPSYEDVEKMVK
ncbi:MAG: insulinase family protein [Alphaproteobacteria bacterium]|nr:insulinase family protein [Alphaproteobacteria bacterium]